MLKTLLNKYQLMTACCNATCGQCGRPGCAHRPGGRHQCCPRNFIDRSPPCVDTRDVVCRLQPTMAAYGFTGEATVSYMECSGTWRYAFRGGRFCCRESNLDMCSSPGSPTDKGMHRHLISGCCRLMGEVIHNSSAWRPSCASNSERRLKLPRPTSPHVVISAAVSTRPASVYNQARSWRFWRAARPAARSRPPGRWRTSPTTTPPTRPRSPRLRRRGTRGARDERHGRRPGGGCC